MKQIHKDSKIILLINMMNKVKLEVIQADLKIKALMQAKDQHFPEVPKLQKRVVFKKYEFIKSFIIYP